MRKEEQVGLHVFYFWIADQSHPTPTPRHLWAAWTFNKGGRGLLASKLSHFEMKRGFAKEEGDKGLLCAALF